jgi:hypothetical protein
LTPLRICWRVPLSGKKLVFDAHLKKNRNFFLFYITESFYADEKLAPDYKFNKHPADTYLKENLSIETSLDSVRT